MGVLILLLLVMCYGITGIAVDMAICKERETGWQFDWVETITWPRRCNL